MIKIKDFAFNPLKGGAFSITATITPEMVEEYGGKMAVMQKMLPLVGTEFVTVTVNETPADVLPQDETNARILEMLEGGVSCLEGIRAYVDSKSQVEMALRTDGGDAGGIGVDASDKCIFAWIKTGDDTWLCEKSGDLGDKECPCGVDSKSPECIMNTA